MPVTSTTSRSESTQQRTPALRIDSLSKSFNGLGALREIDLHIAAGEIHAMVGSNGSGKSTLIKVLSGYHVPDPGASIMVGGVRLPFGSPAASHRIGCRFVHQDLGLIDSLSVADNMSIADGYPSRFGTIRRRKWLHDVARALDRVHLDVDPRRPVAELSPANKTGVALARALQADEHSEPVLLVLDEPTATLPGPEVADLHHMVKTVAEAGVGVLYVSHHLREVFELADSVSVLRDGSAVATTLTSELDHAALVRLMVGSDVSITGNGPTSSRRSSTGPTGPMLRVVGLQSGPLVDLTLDVHPGEIVGLAGITGSGREHVLPALFGAVPRVGGIVEVGGCGVPGEPRSAIGRGIAYVPADRSAQGGLMAMTAIENLTISDFTEFWRFPSLNRRRERTQALEWFDRLDVRPEGAVDQPLSNFSGGNQQKIVLAKWFRRSPRVLLLDEPTQGVDIAAKSLLHRQFRAVAERGSCILISSSDSEELANLCDRVIVLCDGVVDDLLVGSHLSAPSITRAVLGSALGATA